MENIKVIYKDDINYPSKFYNIKKSPDKLYVIGNEKLLNKESFAIVGSRKCTEYGYNQAIKFSKEISKNNICVVSGLAIGIDTAAHIGAMEEPGKTIAVLGCGFNNIYPKENKELFKDILSNGGCIISEYSPNEKADTKNFPFRNRLISGLSDGVLVVEAKYRSGSQVTAKYAKQQKRAVYCLPGDINRTTSVGTTMLMQKGAKIVLSPKDILDDLNIQCTYNEKREKKYSTKKVNKEYKDVYDSLSLIPTNINEICKKTGKSIVEVNISLTMLELNGDIKQAGMNEYVKVIE